MYQLEDIADIIESAGLASLGVDLFLYHAPSAASNCVILYPSNDPPIIDPDMPGYYKAKFQTIVRNNDYAPGLELCKSLSDTLTLFTTETANMDVKVCRPLYQARVYRRSDSGILEMSVSYDIRYTSK